MFNINNAIDKISIKEFKQYWDGYSPVNLTNLYLADDYNYIIPNLNNITFKLSAINDQEFLLFFQNISNYISSIISTNIITIQQPFFQQYVKTINNLTGEVTGISSIILNNYRYNIDDNGMVDLKNYLTKIPLFSFNDKTNNVNVIKSINGILPNKQGLINLGEEMTEDFIFVNSINNMSGFLYGITSFNINSTILNYKNNGQIINITSSLNQYINNQYQYNPSEETNDYNFFDINYCNFPEKFKLFNDHNIDVQSTNNQEIVNIKFFNDYKNAFNILQFNELNIELEDFIQQNEHYSYILTADNFFEYINILKFNEDLNLYVQENSISCTIIDNGRKFDCISAFYGKINYLTK